MADWYVGRGSTKNGPFTSAQLRALAKQGKLRPTDMLSRDDSDQSIEAGKVPDLFPAATAIPEALPTSSPLARASAGPLGIRPVVWMGAAGVVGVSLIAIVWIMIGGSRTDTPLDPSPIAQAPGQTSQADGEPASTELAAEQKSAPKAQSSTKQKKKSKAKASPPLPTTKDKPGPPFAVAPDVALDLLLRLLAQDGVVSNEPLGIGNRKAWDAADPHRLEDLNKIVRSGAGEELRSDLIWIRDAERLGRAPVPELTASIKRLEPAVAMLKQVVKAEEDRKKLRAELAKMSKGPKVNYLEAQIELLHGADEFQLDEMVRKNMISRDEADARLAQRARVKGALIQDFGMNMYNSYIASAITLEKTYYLRNRAEVLRGEVVKETLVPTLRARAGAQQKLAPIEVNFSAFRKGDNIYAIGINDQRGFVTIRSRAAKELTRLTLLMEVHTSVGKRFATFYVPRLSSSASGTFDPFTFSGPALVGDANLRKLVEITGVRFSVWCDQFRAEDQPAQVVAPHQLVLEKYLRTVEPGAVYVSRGGFFMSNREFFDLRQKNPAFKMPQEASGRFEVTVKKLTPAGELYDIEVDLLDRESKAPPQRFSGRFNLPDVKSDAGGNVIYYRDTLKFGQMGKPELETIVLKLRSPKQELDMNLTSAGYWAMTLWDSAEGARPRRSVAARQLVPASSMPQAAK